MDSGKSFWILASGLDSGRCFRFWDVFWILGRVFGFWDVFLDSGKRFWILGSVFGFWDVFWILGSVLKSGKCFVLMSHRTRGLFFESPVVFAVLTFKFKVLIILTMIQ